MKKNDTPAGPPKAVTLAQAAALIGASESTVRRLVKARKLPTIALTDSPSRPVIVIRVAAIDAYLAEQERLQNPIYSPSELDRFRR